ncbi:unnamed protein product [Dovyalis caffra]|uniref:Uncharacterized protein n=1 Tax=Dovyalis caffra TaxID=77055 RepID=A0AAV1R6T7_9ROSI|nr:unnamed protein product [Dovyalis caffra]
MELAETEPFTEESLFSSTTLLSCINGVHILRCSSCTDGGGRGRSGTDEVAKAYLYKELAESAEDIILRINVLK